MNLDIIIVERETQEAVRPREEEDDMEMLLTQTRVF